MTEYHNLGGSPRSFVSFGDACKRLLGALRGPSMLQTMRKTPPRLREMVMLCVSMTNDCAA